MASVVSEAGKVLYEQMAREKKQIRERRRLGLAMEVGGQVFDYRFKYVQSVAASLIPVRPALRHMLLYHEPGRITPGNTIVPLLSSTPDDRFHWSVFFVLLRVGEVAARCVRKRP